MIASVEIEYGVGKFHQFENSRHLFVLVMSIFLVAINVLFKACNEKNGYCKLKWLVINWNSWINGMVNLECDKNYVLKCFLFKNIFLFFKFYF